MLERRLLRDVLTDLEHFPVVALLGPRQVGKTTLALEVAQTRAAEYLDLERPADRAKLIDADAYLRERRGRLLVLDEVQFAPEIFGILRGVIDERVRAGERAGHVLALGSASKALLRQSSESLAGRIAYRELRPFSILETKPASRQQLEQVWLRGGFPSSFLAPSEPVSLRWREQFVSTYVERDVPQLGPVVSTELLRRLWSMLAHGQGDLLNASRLATGLGVSHKTVTRYIDILSELFMVRQLPAWSGSSRKRLMKSPKVYVRDSGLLHSLARIGDLDTLLGHPLCGPSWEGFAVEQLLGSLSNEWSASFYRTSAGAELDLVLEGPRSRVIAIEIKRTSAPSLSRGFLLGAEDVRATERWLVTPWGDEFPIGHETRAIGLGQLVARLANETP